MLEHKDYLSSLNKARKKRNQRLDPRYLVLLLAAIAAVGIIVLGVKSVKKPAKQRDRPPRDRWETPPRPRQIRPVFPRRRKQLRRKPRRLTM